jgi:hypothetical protein
MAKWARCVRPPDYHETDLSPATGEADRRAHLVVDSYDVPIPQLWRESGVALEVGVESANPAPLLTPSRPGNETAGNERY